MFKNANFILAILALAVILAIIVYIIRNKTQLTKLEAEAFIFLLSGISSNMLERFIDGYVTDYIKLNFIDFPVFNFADLFINIGTILLITAILTKKEGQNE